MTIRVGVVVSAHLGFRTYLDNLRHAFAAEPEFEPVWLPVEPTAADRWEWISQHQVRMGLRAADLLRGQRGRIDVALAAAPMILAVRQMRRVPTVLTIDATPLSFNELVVAYGNQPPHPIVERLKTKLNQRVYEASYAVLPWSGWVADSLVDDYRVDPGKIHTIHPGIDLARWAPIERPDRGDAPMRVLFVGGEFFRKGGDLLVNALEDPRLAQVEADLISGDPAARPGTRVRVHQGLAPNSAELLALYARADVLVLPTRGDAVPWVVLEAMASGLPVVSTRVGAIPELVADGETGLLTAPGSLPELADALARLADDPALRARLGRAGRVKVEAEFDARTNGHRVFEVLRAAAAQGRSARARPV